MTRIISRPEVYLISKPSLDWDEIRTYLRAVGERTDTEVIEPCLELGILLHAGGVWGGTSAVEHNRIKRQRRKSN